MLRLFVALRPPPHIRRLLTATMVGVPGARWQDDAQLHVTLRFIGAVDEHVAQDVDAALSTIVATAPSLRVADVGRFDTRGRPSAIWAGVAPVDPLAALHNKIDAALVRAGLEPERRAYVPHITLARLNASSGDSDAWLVDNGSLTSDAWTVDSFELYESRLARGGASYVPIARYPLTHP